MKHVCVFCGSSVGARPEYTEAARHLGRLLADRRLGLVYGGASIGLMGELADAALAAGGEVTGVITDALMVKEVGHPNLAQLHVAASMHERKMKMFELSDAILALPGGVGTLEEFFEVVTWAQLGMHRKPCGLLNVAGYYDGLITFIDHAIEERFIKEKHRHIILADDSPERLLDRFAEYRAPREEKWIDRKRT